jgi:hypothetical protein
MTSSLISQFVAVDDESWGNVEPRFQALRAQLSVDTSLSLLNPHNGQDFSLDLFSIAASPAGLRLRALQVSHFAKPESAAPSAVVATAVPASTTTTASSVSTAIATAVVSASTVPSWISALSTASIAADMAAADVSGKVSYGGLEKLLADVDSTLTSTKTALTSAELKDLKTIAANLNNGMTTSTYLTSVMNALVNGSAANATWTGGAAAAVALGNLAAGSSATQLSELIGKWFLGTDLPSSKVAMTGYPSFSVSYSPCSSPLFAASGPSMNDVNQGYLGDCYLLSGLAEVADQNPNLISSMFTANGNNTYGVRFYINGVANYTTVNNSLANGGTAFNHASDTWASLAEKAYAQLQAGGVITGNTVKAGNSWTTIGNGGYPAYALEEITGASAITNYSAYRGAWATTVYDSSLRVVSSSAGLSTANLLSILTSDLAKGDDLVLTSYTNAKDAAGKTTLVADHAMSIYGYDGATTLLEVRNPWGTMAGQSWNTTFEVSLATLLTAGDVITVDNVGTNAAAAAPAVATQIGTTPSAPKVTAPTAAQKWSQGQAVNLALPGNTFTDPQGQTLTYSAKQANGSALPTWLKFNAATDSFSGVVPRTASTLNLVVKATNTSGLSASETFSVSIATAANKLTRTIAALPPLAGSASAALSRLPQTTIASLASPLH